MATKRIIKLKVKLNPDFVKNLRQYREKMAADGLTVSALAESIGFSRETVSVVLNGRSKCLHGDTHKVAVALGIKTAQVANYRHRKRVKRSQQAAPSAGGGV